MTMQYGSNYFTPNAERRSEAALQKCIKAPTIGCRLKIFMGLGAGVFNGVSEKIIFDLITNLTISDYNQTSTVDRRVYSNSTDGVVRDSGVTAPKLFQETISGAHLTKGSPENLDMLRKFEALEDMQLKLLSVSKDGNIAMLRDYIGSVVGTWGGKDEAYTQKFLKFLRTQKADKMALHGEEAALSLAKVFADGGTPSLNDEDLAWRLTNSHIKRGVFFYPSFASAFSGTLGKGLDGFVEQHLNAIQRVIALLEEPEGVTGAVGKTFGRYANLVDIGHKDLAPAPAVAKLG